MAIFSFLFRASWTTALFATVLGLLSGGTNAGLLALINTALHNKGTSITILALGFLGLGLARVGAACLSQYLLSVFAQKTTTDLRRKLCRQILTAPLRSLEKVGTHRLLVSLTDDVMSTSMALRAIPSVAVDIAMMLGCVVYLGWLSWTTLLVMGGATALGLSFHRGLFARAFRALRLAREEQDSLFRHYRALTEGIKELRLHRGRRETFFDRHIHPSTEAFERHNIAASVHYIIAYGWNQLFFILLIGLALVAMPSLKDISTEIVTGYVLTILYLMGPLRQLMNSFPTFGRANVALQKIEKLGLSLGSSGPDTGSNSHVGPVVPWQRLELKDVTFSYHDEGGDSGFMLGPISLTLRPQELVFFVGGNGSGKSTLVKLLSGLYPPEAGEIRLDRQSISEENREWYRQHFSVVFSDFFLFENLLGLESPHSDAQARHYLDQLQLSQKVQVQDGVLSTTALSQGQRKRLALLTAYLEDRLIYIFDEWAADQDPQFKETFYRELLPELRSRGKTVLVITHDDRYFHLADRIVKLDYGKQVDTRESPIPGIAAGSHRGVV